MVNCSSGNNQPHLLVIGGHYHRRSEAKSPKRQIIFTAKDKAYTRPVKGPKAYTRPIKGPLYEGGSSSLKKREIARKLGRCTENYMI